METLPLWAWGAFLLFITIMLALDLGVFHRAAREVKTREALTWCGVWFALALGFTGLIRWRLGPEASLQWFAAYLVEICLSVDNVFVFIVIFSYFKVPPRHQHAVLFWGIIGAVLMRAVFIVAGVELLDRFHWIIYVFGAFLIITGVKLAMPKKEGDFDPERNPAVRLFRRFFPVAVQPEGEGAFFVRVNGRRMATPLFLVLLVIETTDVAFALDSIPAVLAITSLSFVAFTSNIFAILGLRSLYFALNGVMGLFRFLSIGLAVVLVFIGSKMLLDEIYPVGIGFSLGVIASVLTISVVVSLLFPAKPGRTE